MSAVLAFWDEKCFSALAMGVGRGNPNSSGALPAMSQCAAEVVAPGADRCSRDQMLKTRGSSCDSCRDLPDEGCLWKGRTCLQSENFSFWRDVLVFAGKIWLHWSIPLSGRTSIPTLLNFKNCLSWFWGFILLCSQEKLNLMHSMKTVTDGLSGNKRGGDGMGRDGAGLCYEEPTQEMAAERRLCGGSRSQPAQVLALLGNTGVGFGCHSSKCHCRTQEWSLYVAQLQRRFSALPSPRFSHSRSRNLYFYKLMHSFAPSKTLKEKTARTNY